MEHLEWIFKDCLNRAKHAWFRDEVESYYMECLKALEVFCQQANSFGLPQAEAARQLWIEKYKPEFWELYQQALVEIEPAKS